MTKEYTEILYSIKLGDKKFNSNLNHERIFIDSLKDGCYNLSVDYYRLLRNNNFNLKGIYKYYFKKYFNKESERKIKQQMKLQNKQFILAQG